MKLLKTLIKNIFSNHRIQAGSTESMTISMETSIQSIEEFFSIKPVF